jgi:hypothetical protein
MPDGKTLTFYSNLRGQYDGWTIRTDGSGRTRITDLPNSAVFPLLAPDGTKLVTAVFPRGVRIGSAPFPLTVKTAKTLDGLQVPGGDLTPTYWSRSGRWLSGYIQTPTGDNGGFGVFDFTTGRSHKLNEDTQAYDLAWLPGDRRVVYFTERGKLVIQDVVTLERHEIGGDLPLPPDPFGGVVASPDGRTLFYGARQLESNIWMVRRPVAKRP